MLIRAEFRKAQRQVYVIKPLATLLVIAVTLLSFREARVNLTYNSSAFSAVQAWMICTGAVLFYISDLILAANRFWRPLQYHRVSLAVYYADQCLIALAASYFL